MTTFDDREKSYEKKFALDEELKFRSEQRRNKLIGEWAAGKLGLSGPAVEDYVKTVRKADLATKGDEDVFREDSEGFRRQRRWRCPMPSCVRRWPISWSRRSSRSTAERKA